MVLGARRDDGDRHALLASLGIATTTGAAVPVTETAVRQAAVHIFAALNCASHQGL
jgi:hypothetical protein